MTEGIFFARKDNWAEVNNWPKGHRKARLSADGEAPFGPYTIHEARAKVEEFIKATEKFDLRYQTFAILPLPNEDLSEGLNEFEKLALRKEEAKSKRQKENEDMRADGRVKCFTTGCKNYVKPPRTLCGGHDGNGQFSTHPAEGLPIQTEEPAQKTVAILDVPGVSGALVAHALATVGNQDLHEVVGRAAEGTLPTLVNPKAETIEPDLGLAADEAPFGGPREVTIRKASYDKAQVISLYESGKEIPEIAQALGLTTEQVRYAVKKTEAYKQRKAKG